MDELIVDTDLGTTTISRHIYGHFSEHLGRCIYGGFWAGEDATVSNTRGIRNDVVEALKAIRTPNLRWPGGCFADEYHWRDGIGPREQRPTMVNTHWGGVTENNHFGTHEFMDLCEQMDCEPYICGNLGSGTTQEMAEWVEYLTFDGISPRTEERRTNGRDKAWKVKYWGVGNENWGCGGNMRSEYYADEYRRYATYCRNYSGNRLYKIACGPDSTRADRHYDWLQSILKHIPLSMMDGISVHYYTATWGWKNRSATYFDESDWFQTLRSCRNMDDILTRHSAIMDSHDPAKRIGLIVDEWGTWYDVEPGTNPGFLYQQNSLRDALVAGITLNIFNQHADRVHMANLAQTINVLQSVLLTDGERMVKTPTYHVFDLYKVHQDATLLPIHLRTADYEQDGQKIPALNASASRDAAGVVHISLCNAHATESRPLTIDLRGGDFSEVSGQMVTADTITAHNTFDNPDVVCIRDFNQARFEKGTLLVEMPPRSVVVLTLGK